MVVAKNKKGLALLVAGGLFALAAATAMTPPEYSMLLAPLWLGWLAMVGWLAWSMVAPVLFEAEAIPPPQAISSAFDNFEAALTGLTKDYSQLQANLQTAIYLQETLIDLVVGFIDEAKEIQSRVETVAGGKVWGHDPKLGALLDRLDPPAREKVLATEVANMQAQVLAYRRHAQSLLGRVTEARSSIARHQMKLRTTEAAIPLLEMNESLGECQTTLVEFNAQLPAPAVHRRLLARMN